MFQILNERCENVSTENLSEYQTKVKKIQVFLLK